jgi:hypothetical protein
MRPVVVAGIGVVVVVGGLVMLRHHGGGVAGLGVDALLGQLPPGTTATHGAVSFDPAAGTASIEKLVITKDGQTVFAADNVTATGIEGLSASAPPRRIGHITVTNAAAGKLYEHIARIEIDGLAPETIRQILDASAYQDGKPAWTDRRILVDSVEAFGITGHGDAPPNQTGPVRITGTDITIAHSKISGLSGRQLSAPPSAATLTDPAELASAVLALGETSAATDGVRMELHGLGRFTIGSESATDFADGKLAKAEIDDIAFAGENGIGTFKLQKTTLQDFDLSKLALALPAFAAATKEHRPPRMIADMMRIGGFEVVGLEADFQHAPKVTLASLTSKTESDGGGAQAGTLQMRDLAITYTGRDVPPNVSAALQRFGMQDFKVDWDSATSQNTATGELALTRNDIAVHGLGTLSTVFKLVNWQKLDGTPEEIKAHWRAAKVLSAKFTWKDESLTGRLFHIAAESSGRTEQEVRASADQPLAMLPMFLPDQPDATQQIDNFLDGRHQITITLTPPSPVTIGDLIDAPPQQKASLLGVHISGN